MDRLNPDEMHQRLENTAPRRVVGRPSAVAMGDLAALRLTEPAGSIGPSGVQGPTSLAGPRGYLGSPGPTSPAGPRGYLGQRTARMGRTALSASKAKAT